VSLSGASLSWRARDLELELLDPGSLELARLFQHDHMDWEPPEERYRNLRVDPPPGHKAEFAVLYTASTLEVAAVECRILNVDANDTYSWNQTRAALYRVARYSFANPALFIPIDGKNRETLGLDRPEAAFRGYEPFQVVALELFKRFSSVAHGLSWQSFHRNQPGRAYAIWHDRKSAIDLHITSPTPRPLFTGDPEWLDFLAMHPEIEAIAA
jgi:RES domain